MEEVPEAPLMLTFLMCLMLWLSQKPAGPFETIPTTILLPGALHGLETTFDKPSEHWLYTHVFVTLIEI